MHDEQLSQLFDRYRKGGDVEALTAVFDETAPALLGLANYLVHRQDVAEDVVQATFLAAIESAERYDADFPVRPWLTGILARKAKQANAQKGVPLERRESPSELLSTAPGARDPIEGAAGTELMRNLKQAFADLPDRYRQVLGPFLHDGDKPQDIARDQGIEAGTVRVQIHRGLKLLRDALPAGYAFGALAVTVATPRFAGVRDEVIRAAQLSPLAAQSGAAATAGVATNSKLIGGFLASLIVGALAWQLGWIGPTHAGEDDVTPADGGTNVSVLSADDEDRDAATPIADVENGFGEREGVNKAAISRGAHSLIVTVFGLDTAPPPDLVLAVSGGGQGSIPLELPLDGNVVLTVPVGAGAISLNVTNPAFASFTCVTKPEDENADGEIAVAVELERTHTILTGHVSTPNATEARIGFVPKDAGGSPGSVSLITCEADGSFSLYTDASAGWLVSTAEGCALKGRGMIFEAFENVEIGTLQLDAGAWIEGVAYAAGGLEPDAGQVYVKNVLATNAKPVTFDGRRFGLLSDQVISLSQDVDTSESGRFRVSDLTPGDYDVMFVPSEKMSAQFDVSKDGATVSAPISGIELESPMRACQLRITCEGAPVPDASVEFTVSTGSINGSTQPDGTYSLALAKSSDPLPVSVWKPGFSSVNLMVAPQELAEGDAVEVQLERTAPASNLTLELDCSGVVGSYWLRMKLADSKWHLWRNVKNGTHTLELGDVPAGHYKLSLTPRLIDGLAPPQQGAWLETEVSFDCWPEAMEVQTVTLKPGVRPSIHVSNVTEAGLGDWRIVAAGRPSQVRLLTWDEAESSLKIRYSTGEISADGTYWLLDPLIPGEYKLIVTREEDEIFAESFTVTAGEQVDVFVDLP